MTKVPGIIPNCLKTSAELAIKVFTGEDNAASELIMTRASTKSREDIFRVADMDMAMLN
jgi:hypothetical protein